MPAYLLFLWRYRLSEFPTLPFLLISLLILKTKENKTNKKKQWAKGRSSCLNCMLESCNISLGSPMKPLEGFKYSMHTKLESKHVLCQSKSVSTSGQQPREVGPCNHPQSPVSLVLECILPASHGCGTMCPCLEKPCWDIHLAPCTSEGCVRALGGNIRFFKNGVTFVALFSPSQRVGWDRNREREDVSKAKITGSQNNSSS